MNAILARAIEQSAPAALLRWKKDSSFWHCERPSDSISMSGSSPARGSKEGSNRIEFAKFRDPRLMASAGLVALRVRYTANKNAS